MADFCKQCTEEIIGSDFENDFIGMVSEEESQKGIVAVVLCEGCGPICVDHTGACVEVGCYENHN